MNPVGTSKQHGEEHAKVIVGFLDGGVSWASEAVRLAAGCEQCRAMLRTQADLVSWLRSGEEGRAQSREECLSSMKIAEMTPSDAAREQHLAACPSCRLEWLLAHAEYPAVEAAPEVATVTNLSPIAPKQADEAVEAAPEVATSPWVGRLRTKVATSLWVGRLRTSLSGLIRVPVLVPVAAAAVALVVGVLWWTREPQVFPYEVWTGDPRVLDQMIPQGKREGLAFTGEREDSDLWSFRIGFAAGLVRDLYQQKRDTEALGTYRLVAEQGRLKLDPEVAAELARRSLDPCTLPGVPSVDLCRVGLKVYGLARAILTREALTVDIPATVSEPVIRLHSRLQIAPPEATGPRAAPPGTPENFMGIVLDLFRF